MSDIDSDLEDGQQTVIIHDKASNTSKKQVKSKKRSFDKFAENTNNKELLNLDEPQAKSSKQSVSSAKKSSNSNSNNNDNDSSKDELYESFDEADEDETDNKYSMPVFHNFKVKTPLDNKTKTPNENKNKTKTSEMDSAILEFINDGCNTDDDDEDEDDEDDEEEDDDIDEMFILETMQLLSSMNEIDTDNLTPKQMKVLFAMQNDESVMKLWESVTNNDNESNDNSNEQRKNDNNKEKTKEKDDDQDEEEEQDFDVDDIDNINENENENGVDASLSLIDELTGNGETEMIDFEMKDMYDGYYHEIRDILGATDWDQKKLHVSNLADVIVKQEEIGGVLMSDTSVLGFITILSFKKHLYVLQFHSIIYFFFLLSCTVHPCTVLIILAQSFDYI